MHCAEAGPAGFFWRAVSARELRATDRPGCRMPHLRVLILVERPAYPRAQRFVGYCFGNRSERRLCGEVHLNLAYRWFCRLGLDGDVLNHSTFSKNRHGRFRDSDVLRHVFEMVARRCIAEGLVGGEGFAADASLIKVDANRQSGVQGAKDRTQFDHAVQFVSIWRCWTTRPLARRRPSRGSILRRSIRPRGGLRQMAA
jgi:Transposase domain (DUF772)